MKDSVYSLIRRRRGINEETISFVCKEVLKGIQYLHGNGRVHRDIKSENIMYNENGEIKIADFGFSAQLTVENTLRTTIVGTPAYMAPEFVNIDGYDGKVDIWAVGVLAYEMAEGRVPTNGRNNLEILTNTSNSPSPTLSQPSNWSSEFNHFLSKCFSKNPDERPDAENLLIHPFVVHSTPNSFKLIINSA